MFVVICHIFISPMREYKIRGKGKMKITWINVFKYSIGVFTSALVFVGSIIVLNDFIDNKIDKKLNSQEYIHKLSSTLRPYLIFDEKGNFLFDHGATAFIDTLIINKDFINQNTAMRIIEIIIHPKQIMQFPPNINAMTPVSYTLTINPYQNISWKYRFEITTIFNYQKNIQFQLEIIN